MLATVFGAERFWTYIYDRSFTIELDHKALESISQKNLADMPAHLQCMLLCLQGYDYTIHYHPSKEMALPDTLSQFSPHPGPDIPLDIAIHHACLSPERKEAFQQAFVSNSWNAHSCWHDHHWLAWQHQGSPMPITPILAALRDPHHGRWPCPMWRSPHHSSVKKGEGTTATPPVPSRNHQSLVVPTWMCLLAGHKHSHRRSSLAVWDLHPVPSTKCCSIPHSYANSVPPMADVCHGHLYLRRNQLPDMWQLLFKDDPHLMSSIQPEQHCQSHLTAQRDVLRAWNFQSTSLWQWHSVCKCTVHWVLHLLGYHTWDLKPSLPIIEWICWGMCKICEACTPMC